MNAPSTDIIPIIFVFFLARKIWRTTPATAANSMLTATIGGIIHALSEISDVVIINNICLERTVRPNTAGMSEKLERSISRL